MSINVKQKLSFAIRENSTISKGIIKNFSNIRNQIKNKHLTDNKEIPSNYDFKEKTNFNLKKKDSTLANREAEYDRNLRRIKSNLLDRFNNYSFLSIKNNLSGINESQRSKKKKTRRERSRYNIKTYSPSVINEKKFSYLEKDNSEILKNLQLDVHKTKNEFGDLLIEENLKKNFEKSKIISMRRDDKENYEEDQEILSLDSIHMSSKSKIIKKRFAKKIKNIENNLFTIDNENNANCSTTTIKKDKMNELKYKYSFIRQGMEMNKYGSIIKSANNSGFGKEIKRNILTNTKNILINKKINNSESHSTKNTQKKFLFNRIKVELKSKQNSQSKLSDLKNRISQINFNNENSNIKEIDHENILLKKELNFKEKNNFDRINYKTNSNINGENDISFDDDNTINAACEEKMIDIPDDNDNQNEFFEKIQKNYKEFIKGDLLCEKFEEKKHIEDDFFAKDLDKEIEMKLADDISFNMDQESNLENVFNSDLKRRFELIKRNSGLEIIQENTESDNIFNNNADINSEYSSEQINYMNQKGTDMIFNYEMNGNINKNINNTEKNCILESGGLSKKFSEMKRTINNNLNHMNINGMNESDYKIQNILLNNNSERFFASSLINSMESIKNMKQNLQIFSNNLNKNNENFYNFNNNPDLSCHKIIGGVENKINYQRSLENSSFNNINSQILINKNLQNEKTPDIVNDNHFLNQKNLHANAMLSQNPYTSNNLFDNNAFINSTLFNSNNIDLKFNNLNILSNSHNLIMNNEKFSNSNYHSSNIIQTINQKFSNNMQFNCTNKDILNLSGQFKNFNNHLTKINLLDMNNINDHNNNIPLEYDDKMFHNLSKNECLQEQINLINLSFDILNNHEFKEQNHVVKKKSNTENSIADKLIFFSTEQYRNLLNVFLNIDYGYDILKELQRKNFEYLSILSKHGITERMRTKMVDWMIEVMENYRCDHMSYFLAVSLMDRYFIHSERILSADDLHIIGICCMFISSKFVDIFPIKLCMAAEKISHGKISKEEIKNYEEIILKTINYEVLVPTSFEFLNFFIEEIFNVYENNYNIKNEILREYLKLHREMDGDFQKFDKNFYEKFSQTKDFDFRFIGVLRKIVLYLSKMNCYDVNLSKLKPASLAAGTLFLATKIAEQILQSNFVNEYFLQKIIEISLADINEIHFISEKILFNCQNFERNFPNLENLKKFYFDFLN